MPKDMEGMEELTDLTGKTVLDDLTESNGPIGGTGLENPIEFHGPIALEGLIDPKSLITLAAAGVVNLHHMNERNYLKAL
jgi:hypothetical protein